MDIFIFMKRNAIEILSRLLLSVCFILHMYDIAYKPTNNDAHFLILLAFSLPFIGIYGLITFRFQSDKLISFVVAIESLILFIIYWIVLFLAFLIPFGTYKTL